MCIRDSIYTAQAKDVISVPIQAVTAKAMNEENDDDLPEENLSDDDFKEIVFVTAADTVSMKEVKTGIQDDEFIQIISGLEKGDKIVKGPYTAISSKLEEGSEIYEKDEDQDDSDEK